MSDTAKQFLSRRQNQHALVANNLLETNLGDQVLFYPSGGLDWNPLYRLTHLAKVFLYVESSADQDAVTKSIRQIDYLSPVGKGLSAPGVGLTKIGSSAMKRMGLLHDDGKLLEPWGLVAEITRIVGGEKRKVWLIYLGCSPIRAYQRLFRDRHMSPKVLCLAHGSNGKESAAWNGPLGTAVAANDKGEPAIIIRGKEPDDWPWTRFWQEFASWDGRKAYTAQCPAAPDRTRKKRLVISRLPLTPRTVGDAQAVLIGVKQFREFAWPDHLTLLLDTTGDFKPDERTRRLNLKFTAVPVTGLPLAEALLRVESACGRGKIKRVAAGKLGFEDEGLMLESWRLTRGHLEKLTLHCPHDGDVLSFGPFADHIES